MAFVGLPPRPADSKSKTWIFNPPPGWPVPPGWQPPDNWHPGLAWPPAPAGWEFWKPRRKPRGAGFYVKTTAGVLTFVATITGTYLAYLAIRSHPVTTASWVHQANAVCNQDVGPLNVSLFQGLAPVVSGQSNPSTQQSVVSKLSALVAAQASLGKLVGDLDALQTPTDNRAPEVQSVLNRGNTLLNSLGSFSSLAQTAVEHSSGSPVSPQTLVELHAADKHFLNAEFAWERAILVLRLTQCPGWTRHPTLVLPTFAPRPTPSPTATLTAVEQQLVNSLNPNDLTDCTGRPDQEGGSIVAAVNCQNVATGPTKRPLIVQFSDAVSAEAWFSSNTANFVDENNCAAGFKRGTWAHSDVTAGSLGCAYIGDGDFRMVWTIDSAMIGVIADGTDGSVMYSWWTQSAYVTAGGD